MSQSGRLVGHDIELAHLLASDLGASLELIPFSLSKLVVFRSNQEEVRSDPH
jgi:hypothetical protein